MVELVRDEERGLAVERVERPGRRDFLFVGLGTAAAVAAGGCGVRVRRDLFPVGPTAELPEGRVTLVEAGPFLLGRDEGGLYAMSAACTHLGCRLSIEDDRLPCGCHGSVFALDGAVVAGPARQPLDHFRVVVEGGRVSVDTREQVPAETRVPVV